MSVATLDAVARAIEAHHADMFARHDDPEVANSVVINWVVGYTVSTIATTDDGSTEVIYVNNYLAAEGDPNAAAFLASWVSDEIALAIGGSDDDED